MYGMVLPRFVEAALEERAAAAFTATATRRAASATSRDVVDALVKLSDTPAAVGQVFNLGGDEEVSINDLAKRVISWPARRARIEHVSYEQAYGHRFDDMPRRVPELDTDPRGDRLQPAARPGRHHPSSVVDARPR